MTTAALDHFNAALREERGDHGALTCLREAGWIEQFPEEDRWTFRHAHFDSIVIGWLPGREPWLVRVDLESFQDLIGGFAAPDVIVNGHHRYFTSRK